MKPATGETLVAEVTSVNSRGEGVARYGDERFVLFAAGALPGEKVKGRVRVVKKTYGALDVLEILEPGTHRHAPECPWFGLCGGCSLQHADYGLQSMLKKRSVQDALMKELGAGYSSIVKDCVKSPREWRYRNKAVLPVRSYGKKTRFGFFRRDSHDIVPVESCPVLQEPLGKIMSDIPFIIDLLGWPAYSEKYHSGLLRHIALRFSNTGTISITLVTRSFSQAKSQKGLKNLCTFLEGKYDTFSPSVFVNVNQNRGNRIFGLETHHVAGPACMEEKVGNHTLRLGPTSFFQVNPFVSGKLIDTALSAFAGGMRVVELYSGVGAMTLPLADKSAFLHAAESWPEAAGYLKRNLSENGFTNAKVIGKKAEEALGHIGHGDCEGLLLDPPRSGCSREVLEKAIRLRPERIVYVSCNPATLARDLKLLIGGGYGVLHITPFDMFPQTTHVETAAVLALP